MLPDAVRALLEPLLSPAVLLGLGVFSVVMFIASLVGVPYFLSRLPANYFTRQERHQLGLPETRSQGLHLLWKVLRNLLGALLLLLGILMLVLPGQAILTILIAVLLMDFPGKRRFERWIIARPSVMHALNKLRHRAGQPPLEPRPSWPPMSSRTPVSSRSKAPPVSEE